MLTYRVHESAVHVGVEQVGHGKDGAVAERCQAAGHAPLPARYLLPVILHLTAVVQQVHEQGEVPDGGDNYYNNPTTHSLIGQEFNANIAGLITNSHKSTQSSLFIQSFIFLKEHSYGSYELHTPNKRTRQLHQLHKSSINRLSGLSYAYNEC